jgi:supervillin
MVEPSIESLNQSGCFVLVAPLRLFLLIGDNANIIEKSKANEIYDWIRLKRDLGIKAQTTCCVINSTITADQDKNNLSFAEKEFISFLKQQKNEFSLTKSAGCQEDDEKYELLINDTNMVFKVMKINETDDDERCLKERFQNYNDENSEENNELANYCLQPVDKYWGRILSYNMLDENDVFVFDFGAEVCNQIRKKAFEIRYLGIFLKYLTKKIINFYL